MENFKTHKIILLSALLFLIGCTNDLFAETLVPRTIIALYVKSKYVKDLANTNIHKYAEMPLNFLGFKLEYIDIEQRLPNITQRDDVYGVISWYEISNFMKSPENYLNWAEKVITSGKKFLVMGEPGFTGNNKSKDTSLSSMNRFWKKLGIKDTGNWVNLTLGCNFNKENPEITNFERAYPLKIPTFEIFIKINKKIDTILSVINNNTDNDCQLIVVSPNGGYAAENFNLNLSGNVNSHPQTLQWYIDPFKFLSLIYNADDIPKPDVTTLAGRRIYFSHIDGDGWDSYTKIEEYRSDPILCPEVIMDKVIKKFPELPVTVAPIIAEIDTHYAGTPTSRRIAKELFALPQVQAGSHTFSHPFNWSFFKDKNNIKESYSKQGFWSIFKKKQKESGGESSLEDFDKYAKPRAYAFGPFNLNQELAGSIQALQPLLPKSKKAELIQWPGDCMPFERAVRMVRKSGLYAINGGDSRFDPAYPSYAWIYPIGRQVGKEEQIYAASSNENTYTDLWTKDFFAFKFLIQTLKNTNSPLRISPIDIYYHMYSGEHTASVNAIITDIKFSLTQDIIPITTTDYTRIAGGFYTTKFYKTEKNSWIIKDRGKLQTIRFSKAIFKTVDFSKSIGVVGQRHFEGSLYVYLDSSVHVPKIVIIPTDTYWCEPTVNLPYLIESRWQVWSLEKSIDALSFEAKGFGDCKMSWSMPENGNYDILLNDQCKKSVKTLNNILNFEIKLKLYNKPVKLSIKRSGK